MKNQIVYPKVLLVDSNPIPSRWLNKLLASPIEVRKISKSQVDIALRNSFPERIIIFFLIDNEKTEKVVFNFILQHFDVHQLFRFLLIVEKVNVSFVKSCLRFGSVTLVLKEEFEKNAPTFVLQTSNSNLSASPKLILALLENFKQPAQEILALQQLTPREMEVLVLIIQGLSNSAIKSILGISENTVKSLTYKMYKKLAVKNRVEAVRRFWHVR